VGETAGNGEPRSAFGQVVEYLKRHPPLLFGLGGGMLVIASAKKDIRPITVPLLVLLLASLVVWVAVERLRTGSFSFVQGRHSTVRRSRIGQGEARGRRVVRTHGVIEDSEIGNVGSRPEPRRTRQRWTEGPPPEDPGGGAGT